MTGQQKYNIQDKKQDISNRYFNTGIQVNRYTGDRCNIADRNDIYLK